MCDRLPREWEVCRTHAMFGQDGPGCGSCCAARTTSDTPQGRTGQSSQHTRIFLQLRTSRNVPVLMAFLVLLFSGLLSFSTAQLQGKISLMFVEFVLKF